MSATVENRSVEFVEGKGWVKTCPAHLIWLNDIAPNANIGDRTAQYHVHAAECGDLRKYKAVDEDGLDLSARDGMYLEATSKKELVEHVYRYGGSFYEESGIPEAEWDEAWRLPEYLNDFKFFPCVKLPDEPTYEEV